MLVPLPIIMVLVHMDLHLLQVVAVLVLFLIVMAGVAAVAALAPAVRVVQIVLVRQEPMAVPAVVHHHPQVIPAPAVAAAAA
jgi:hypothetical protein